MIESACGTAILYQFAPIAALADPVTGRPAPITVAVSRGLIVPFRTLNTYRPGWLLFRL